MSSRRFWLLTGLVLRRPVSLGTKRFCLLPRDSLYNVVGEFPEDRWSQSSGGSPKHPGVQAGLYDIPPDYMVLGGLSRY